jgi:hypothetical protein
MRLALCLWTVPPGARGILFPGGGRRSARRFGRATSLPFLPIDAAAAHPRAGGSSLLVKLVDPVKSSCLTDEPQWRKSRVYDLQALSRTADLGSCAGKSAKRRIE